MTSLQVQVRLRNPLVWVTGGTSILGITFPVSETNWQFGIIKNLSASSALTWSAEDNVMYKPDRAKEVTFNGVTYYEIPDEDIVFKEVPLL